MPSTLETLSERLGELNSERRATTRQIRELKITEAIENKGIAITPELRTEIKRLSQTGYSIDDVLTGYAGRRMTPWRLSKIMAFDNAISEQLGLID